jgi:hypothetical protein
MFWSEAKLWSDTFRCGFLAFNFSFLILPALFPFRLNFVGFIIPILLPLTFLAFHSPLSRSFTFALRPAVLLVAVTIWVSTFYILF